MVQYMPIGPNVPQETARFKPMRNRLLVSLLVAFGIVVIAGAGWAFVGRGWWDERQLSAEIAALKADPRTAESAERLEKNMQRVAEDPADVEALIGLGNSWKQVFDMTGEDTHVVRAIAAYERAVDASQGKNTVVLSNLATAYRLAKRPQQAENVLREAIAANAGDPTLYIQLVEVLRIDLKRGSEEIIDVYRLGLDQLVDNAPLVQSLAIYLEDIGRLRDALTYYKLLAPTYPTIAEKVAELERRIAQEESESAAP